MKYKTTKIRIENEKCKEKYLYVVLPINEDELLDITSDVIGRDKEGRLLDGYYNAYITRTKKEVEDVYELNKELIELNNIEMPEYNYGNNPYVFKENGAPYKGTIESRLMPLIEGER